MNQILEIDKIIESGRLVRPQRIVIYGPNGIGKSTLAEGFPSCIFVDTKDGTCGLNVRRIRVLDSDSFHNVIRALTKADKLDFQTLIIDTIDQGEKYVRDRILRIHRLNAIEDFGYGKGWTFLREEFERLLTQFDRFIERDVHVVVIGHSTVKRYQPPLAETGYDRYQLKLYDHNSDRLKEWADAVLFINWDTKVVDSREGKPRGVGGRTRVIHTTHSAGWDAKIRVDLPEKLPCEFDALQPLFGPQQKEVKKEQDPAAAASVSPEDTAPTPPVDADLHDRLLDVIGDLDKDDVRHYLASKKRISKSGWLDELSPNQVTWIINHAEEFRAAVKKFASEPF
jgi:AAA domain